MRRFRASLSPMGDLRLVELSATTIVAVNNLSLKPGQEQFLAPISYAVAGAVSNPATAWQRVVLDDDTVVAFVSANFDDDAPEEHFKSRSRSSSKRRATAARTTSTSSTRRV